MRYNVLHLTVINCIKNTFSDNYLILAQANSLNKTYAFNCLNEIPIGKFINFKFVKLNAEGETIKNYNFFIIDDIILPVQQYYIESTKHLSVEAFIYETHKVGHSEGNIEEAVKVKCFVPTIDFNNHYDNPYSNKIKLEFIISCQECNTYQDNKCQIELGNNLIVSNLIYNREENIVGLTHTLISKKAILKIRKKIHLRKIKELKTDKNTVVHLLISEETNIHTNKIYLFFSSKHLEDYEEINLNVEEYCFTRLTDIPKEYVDTSLFYRGCEFVFEEWAITSVENKLKIEECDETLVRNFENGHEFYIEGGYQYRRFNLNGKDDILIYNNPDYSEREWESLRTERLKRNYRDNIDWGFEGDASNLWNID